MKVKYEKADIQGKCKQIGNMSHKNNIKEALLKARSIM